MIEGFQTRAEEISRLLRAPSTAFVLVTTPDTAAVFQARQFIRRLADRVAVHGLLPGTFLNVNFPDVPWTLSSPGVSVPTGTGARQPAGTAPRALQE